MTLKIAHFKDNFRYNKAVCFTGYSLEQQSKSKAQKQNET